MQAFRERVDSPLPTPGDVLLGGLSKLGLEQPAEAARQALEQFYTGVESGFAIPEVLSALSGQPVEEFAPPPEGTVQELARMAGGIAPYLAVSPVAGAVGRGTAGLLGRYAPRIAATALGRALPGIAGTAALGGTVAAGREAVRGLAKPEEFDAERALREIGSEAGWFAALGGVSRLVGGPARTAMRNLLGQAVAAGRVTPALESVLTEATGGAATGTALGALDMAVRWLKNPEEFDTAQAAGDAVKLGVFFGLLDGMFGLMYGQPVEGQRARERGGRTPLAEDYEFVSGELSRAELEGRGLREFRPGTGLWVDARGNPAMREVVGWDSQGRKIYRYELERTRRRADITEPAPAGPRERAARPEAAPVGELPAPRAVRPPERPAAPPTELPPVTELAPGQRVRLKGKEGWFEVLELPAGARARYGSQVRLRAPGGAELTIGHKALEKGLVAVEGPAADGKTAKGQDASAYHSG